MKPNTLKRNPGLSTIVLLIITYTLVYLFERALARLVHVQRMEPSFPPYTKVDLVSAIYPMLILLVIAALAWFVLFYLPPNRIGPIFLLLTGLFIVVMRYYHYLIFYYGDVFFPPWLYASTPIGNFRLSFMNFGAFGYQASIYYLASGCIIIGAAAFWRKKQSKPGSIRG